MPNRKRADLRPGLLLALALAGGSAWSASEDEHPLKLTLGDYRFRGQGEARHGTDVNLRHSSAMGNVWLGVYTQDAGSQRQTRGGWDRFFDAGPLRVQGSLQAASGGFLGGSLYAEAGKDWYAGAGLGRTNLRPYINLNFDPNDAITLAAGRRWQGQSLGLVLVADNRQNPDQRHLHLVWRASGDGGDRWTVDLLAKQGQVEGERIRRSGLSLTYDQPDWFVRAAWDPRVNFTTQDMLRLSAGARF